MLAGGKKNYVRHWPIVIQKNCCTCKYTLTQHFLQEVIFNPLNAELNPIYHLLALLGAHHIFQVSGLRVNLSEMLHKCNFDLLFYIAIMSGIMTKRQEHIRT